MMYVTANNKKNKAIGLNKSKKGIVEGLEGGKERGK